MKIEDKEKREARSDQNTQNTQNTLMTRHFLAILVDENGRIWTNGDNSLAEKLFTKVNETKKQSWVPAGPLPCLPRHLSEMQNYHHFGEIKRTASPFINHFKKHGQKLGEVPNFKNK